MNLNAWFFEFWKNNNKQKEKKTEKIFSIIKDKEKQQHENEIKQFNKKKGRRRKSNHKSIKTKMDKKYHSKSKEDNMIHKIKVFFIQSTMNFINKRFEDFEMKKGNKKAKLISKIKSKFTQTIKKEPNLQFLNTKIKDLFSSDLSEKCTKLTKDYNKQQIKELYQKNEAKEIIEILEKNVEELLKIYVNGDYASEGFYIENDLNEEKEKMIKNEEEGIDDYAEHFIETARNLGKIFRMKIPRRKKQKKLAK